MEGGGEMEGGGMVGVMEGGDSEAHSPGLVVAHFHSFHLRPCTVVFVHGGRVCPHSWAVVLVHGQLSSFMGGVHVLGVRHSCVGVVVVRIVVCGHCVVVHGWWGLFVGGVHRLWLGA